MIELNKMSTIEAKLDALMSKLCNQERRSHSLKEVGTLEGVEQKCVDEGLAHESPYKVGEVQYLNSNRSYNYKLKQQPSNSLLTSLKEP